VRLGKKKKMGIYQNQSYGTKSRISGVAGEAITRALITEPRCPRQEPYGKRRSGRQDLARQNPHPVREVVLTKEGEQKGLKQKQKPHKGKPAAQGPSGKPTQGGKHTNFVMKVTVLEKKERAKYTAEGAVNRGSRHPGESQQTTKKGK